MYEYPADIRSFFTNIKQCKKVARGFLTSMHMGQNPAAYMLPRGFEEVLPCPFGPAEMGLTLLSVNHESAEHRDKFADMYLAAYATHPLVDALGMSKAALLKCGYGWFDSWCRAKVACFALADSTGRFIACVIADDVAISLRGSGLNPELLRGMSPQDTRATTQWKMWTKFSKGEFFERFPRFDPYNLATGVACTGAAVVRPEGQAGGIGAFLLVLGSSIASHRGYRFAFVRPSNPRSIAFFPRQHSAYQIAIENAALGEFSDPTTGKKFFTGLPQDVADIRSTVVCFALNDEPATSAEIVDTLREAGEYLAGQEDTTHVSTQQVVTPTKSASRVVAASAL